MTKLCNTASEPNDKPAADGLADVDHFARFVRSLKAPSRDQALAATPAARKGSDLFDKIGCAVCHVRTLETAAAGTRVNGGAFVIPTALGSKTFHPYSDFLMHDVGTGDGIVVPTVEHYGRATRQMPRYVRPRSLKDTQQSAYGAVMGSAPAYPLNARWRVINSLRCHSAAWRRGRSGRTRFSQAGWKGPRGGPRIPKIALDLDDPVELNRWLIGEATIVVSRFRETRTGGRRLSPHRPRLHL